MRGRNQIAYFSSSNSAFASFRWRYRSLRRAILLDWAVPVSGWPRHVAIARKGDGMGLTLTIALLLAAFLIVAAALIAAFGDVTAKPRRHGDPSRPAPWYGKSAFVIRPEKLGISCRAI